MKKIILTLSVFGLLVFLAGCSNGSEDQDDDSSSDNSKLENKDNKKQSTSEEAVSYTHLTLPTIAEV